MTWRQSGRFFPALADLSLIPVWIRHAYPKGQAGEPTDVADRTTAMLSCGAARRDGRLDASNPATAPVG